MKKLIVTMCIGDWEPEITAQSFALMKFHAKKIKADFLVIDQRKFPDKPLCFERFQIRDLVDHYDWIIQLDADLLMHPDMPDVTEMVTKETILMSMWDWAPKRFVMDNYFRRDGRYISVPGFYLVTSDYHKDFWTIPDDLTVEQMLDNVTPVMYEWAGRKLGKDHVVLDYIFSRNVAKYGLKVESFQNLFKVCSSQKHMALGGIEDFIMHNSHLPIEHKRQHIKQVLDIHWKINPKEWKLL